MASTPAASTITKRLFGLDHLRAAAILLVLFYHYRMFNHPAWMDDSMHFGWTGVDLFFVLSGYLIASQLFEKMARGAAVSFPRFFIKRAFRIIPAYLLVLAIYFLFPGFHEREALPPLWKFLSFTQNFGFDIKNFGTFSHAWSLCVEEHFYLLLPLVLITVLYFKATRKAWVLLPILFVFGFAARLYSWYVLIEPHINENAFGIIWYKYMYYPSYNRLDGLLAGVSIAALFTFRPQWRDLLYKRGNILLLSGIIVLIGAAFFCSEQMSFHASVFGYPLVAAGYGLLVMGAVSPGSLLYRYNINAMALIAKLSFSLYLAHKGIIHVGQPILAKCGLAPAGNSMFILCLLLALAGAWVINQVVEQPFLRLRTRILEKMKNPRRMQETAAIAGERP